MEDRGPIAPLTQRRLEAVLDAMQEVVVVVGPDGRNRFANQAMQTVLGYPPEEVLGTSTIDRIHPDDRDRALAAFGSIIHEGGASVTFRYRALHKSGHWLPCEAKGTNLLHDPAVHGLVITVRDLSEELAATARFQQIADNATDVIYRMRFEPLSFEYVNDAVTRVTGLSPSEIMADPHDVIARIIHPDDLPKVARYLARDFTAPHMDTVELRWVHTSGRHTWAEHRFSILRHPDGTPRLIDAIARDISTLKAIEQELSALAQQDDLTGLPNRRALLDIIRDRIDADGAVGVLFIDLDGFKEVNDSLGHDAGDHLLVAVAGRLSANIRADDVVVRFAGDEFVVLTDEDSVPWLADRLLHELDQPFGLYAGIAHISASIGTAIGRASDEPTALLRRADQAMYDAKRSGGNRIAVR